MRKISIALTAIGGLLLSSAAGYALSSDDTGVAKSLQIAQAGGGGGGAGGGAGAGGAGGMGTGGGAGGGAATSPGGTGGASTRSGGAGGGAATSTGGGGGGRESMGASERGGREGMRGESRGEREGMRGDRGGRGADVNVRVGGGDRGYGRGYGGSRTTIYGHRRPGYGVYVRGGGCRTIVVKKRIGYRVVIKRIRRCY